MLLDQRRDRVAMLRDRQLLGKAWGREACEARGATFARTPYELREQGAIAFDGPSLARARGDRRRQRRDPGMVGGERRGQNFGRKRGHGGGRPPFYVPKNWCQVRIIE